MVDSYLTQLRKGVAAVAAAESGGLIQYKPSGKYTGAGAGIYGSTLPEQPDEAIALTTYGVSASPEWIAGVQFRFRAASDIAADAIEDALTRSFSERQNGSLGDVTLIMSLWSSGATLGQDGSDRVLRSINFYMTVHRPMPNRT